jgi:hypothetical protein
VKTVSGGRHIANSRLESAGADIVVSSLNTPRSGEGGVINLDRDVRHLADRQRIALHQPLLGGAHDVTKPRALYTSLPTKRNG